MYTTAPWPPVESGVARDDTAQTFDAALANQPTHRNAKTGKRGRNGAAPTGEWFNFLGKKPGTRSTPAKWS